MSKNQTDLTRDGNYAMHEYCKRSQIQVNACGKLVVAKDAGDLQGLDIETQRLEMDFVLEGDSESVHILNAVSPAFTCALSFSNFVCDYIQKKLN